MLAVIGKIGTAGGTGYAIEFAGSAIRALQMEGRMTVCNMAIEAGARAGLVARRRHDDRLPARPAVRARRATSGSSAVALLAHAALATPDAQVRPRRRRSTRATIQPQVTWGTSPEMVVADRRPRARSRQREATRASATRWSARCATWGSSRTRRSPTSASTRSSSARAPTRASRTCARRPRSCAGSARASRQRQAGDGGAGLGPGEGAGRARRARPRLQAAPASSGASRAARCAWR